MVAALLEAGADPNACGALGLGTLCSATPLSAAVTQGSAKTVAALLAARANPNAPMSFGMGMFASVTPLYTAGLAASRSESTEMVAALIKAGADTGARSMAGLVCFSGRRRWSSKSSEASGSSTPPGIQR